MFRNFDEIEKYVFDRKEVKTIALANAQDDNALEAVILAHKKGLVNGILIGDVDLIKEMLEKNGENVDDYMYIQSDDELNSAQIAVGLVREGKADFPMKGLMMTSSFMKAILDKENGLMRPDCILSQATLLEFKEENRFMIISDCAVNINPGVEQKIKITNNTIDIAHKLGIEKPNISLLSALEKVNPKIQSTVDAEEVAKYPFEGINEIAGPLALDITISKEAAIHKGVTSDVCGMADILIVPDLNCGNIFSKALVFFAHMKSAGLLLGSSSPVIMTSRTDTIEDKYLAILMALFQTL